MHTGEITTTVRPSWTPLIAAVGSAVVPNFYWVDAIQLDDGGEVHVYGNATTRRRLHLGADGRAFAARGGRQYEQVTMLAALESVFDGWEYGLPRPRNVSAIADMLERHRAGIWLAPDVESRRDPTPREASPVTTSGAASAGGDAVPPADAGGQNPEAATPASAPMGAADQDADAAEPAASATADSTRAGA